MKNISRRTRVIVVLGGFAALFLFFPYFNSKDKIESDEALLIEQGKINLPDTGGTVSLPVRLKIPKLNVNAVVEQVGLTTGGAVDVPKGRNNVAWFNLGPRPGQVGSSVIDGHSGYKNNEPAVFDDLYKLKKGDKIYVEDDQGASVSFLVRGFRSYGAKESPSAVFGVNDRIAHLNLITCDGVWNPVLKTHSNRLVIFADRE